MNNLRELDQYIRTVFPSVRQPDTTRESHQESYIRSAVTEILRALETPNLTTAVRDRLQSYVTSWSGVKVAAPVYTKLNFLQHNELFDARVPELSPLPEKITQVEYIIYLTELNQNQANIDAAQEAWLSLPANPQYLNQKIATYDKWRELIATRKTALMQKFQSEDYIPSTVNVTPELSAEILPPAGGE
jgi:hypothetical protein